MLNLELDILDTVEYSGSMLCVEQQKGSENPLFLRKCSPRRIRAIQRVFVQCVQF